jgi:DNA-3-methyladenine glycosylase
MQGSRLDNRFFQREVLQVAPELVGKVLVRRFNDGMIKRYRITETEAYRGEEDLACHAAKGRTPRTEVMYHAGGQIYVYLIYGMYWMLNVVTSEAGFPAAVLIRGLEGFDGPGKVGRELMLDKTFYGEDLTVSERIWVEDDGFVLPHRTYFRVGIDYAGEVWKNKLWRFMVAAQKNSTSTFYPYRE